LYKLSIQRKSHPIRILIEASAGREDARQKSRWSHALKYAFGWLQLPERLEWFFSVNGGIAGSARKSAILNAQRKATRIIAAAGSVAEKWPGRPTHNVVDFYHKYEFALPDGITSREHVIIIVRPFSGGEARIRRSMGQIAGRRLEPWRLTGVISAANSCGGGNHATRY
jgi:hypothetical protein